MILYHHDPLEQWFALVYEWARGDLAIFINGKDVTDIADVKWKLDSIPFRSKASFNAQELAKRLGEPCIRRIWVHWRYSDGMIVQERVGLPDAPVTFPIDRDDDTLTLSELVEVI